MKGGASQRICNMANYASGGLSPFETTRFKITVDGERSNVHIFTVMSTIAKEAIFAMTKNEISDTK